MHRAKHSAEHALHPPLRRPPAGASGVDAGFGSIIGVNTVLLSARSMTPGADAYRATIEEEGEGHLPPGGVGRGGRCEGVKWAPLEAVGV